MIPNPQNCYPKHSNIKHSDGIAQLSDQNKFVIENRNKTMFEISIPWCKSVIRVATAPHCNGHAQHIAFDMQYTKSSHHCEIVQDTNVVYAKYYFSK